MLRHFVLGGRALIPLGGAVLLLSQPSQAFGPLLFGGLLVFGTLFERWRYKNVKTAQTARGTPTGERFVDTETGAVMEVYYDAATGERSYVRVPDAAARDKPA